ncbi:MAG: endonuclease domain-containing protein, partial [Acidiferrobacterales bacterium]
MRKNQTEAEKRLWWHLRNRQMEGCKFRRQEVIGDYIVDFLCLEPKLIIEVDGGHHIDQYEYDQVRTKYLASLGYKVIRFWNNDVLANTPAVLEKIREEI